MGYFIGKQKYKNCWRTVITVTRTAFGVKHFKVYIKLFDVCCSDPEYCVYIHTSPFPVKSCKIQSCAEKGGGFVVPHLLWHMGPDFGDCPSVVAFYEKQRVLKTFSKPDPHGAISVRFIYFSGYLYVAGYFSYKPLQHLILPQTMSVYCSNHM